MDKNTVLEHLTVGRAAKCRTANDESYQVQFTIDYTGCTIGELLEWATSTKTIAGQRAWEKMTKEELFENVNGKTFHARDIGKKVKSRTEQVNDFYIVFYNSMIAQGMDKDECELKARELAEAAVDNPQALHVAGTLKEDE